MYKSVQVLPMLRRGNFFDKSSGALALKQELSMYMYMPYVCACVYYVCLHVYKSSDTISA